MEAAMLGYSQSLWTQLQYALPRHIASTSYSDSSLHHYNPKCASAAGDESVVASDKGSASELCIIMLEA